MIKITLLDDALIEPLKDFYSLLYFLIAALVSLGVEAIRRYIRHRLAIWESEHPIKKDKEDDGKENNG